MCHRSHWTPVGLLVAIAFFVSSCGGNIPAPSAGVPRYQRLGLIVVPGGAVNAAGGNLLVERTDLSIDTRIGTRELGAVYNSASRNWRWSFETTLLDGVFTSPTGSVHDTSGLGDGGVIPGTAWQKRGPSAMQTLGGLVHEFDASGRLLAVYWASDPHPRLEFVPGLVGDVMRTVRIQQCTAPGSCVPVFELRYDASARLVEVSDRAGRRASFGWDAGGGLAWARDAHDLAHDWPGFRYEYDGSGRLRSMIDSEGERVEFDYTGGRIAAVRPVGLETPVHAFEYARGGSGVYETLYTGAAGEQVRYHWKADRTVTGIDWPRAGESAAFAWTGQRLVEIVDPGGYVTGFSYPSADVTQVSLPGGNTVTVEWAPSGVDRSRPMDRAVASLSDDLGLRLVFGYDAAGRLVSRTNGLGETWLASYDGQGQVTTLTSPTGRMVSFLDHGEDGHPRTLEEDGNVIEERVYDLVGNLVRGSSVVDPYATSSPGVVERSFDDDRGLAGISVWGLTPAGSSLVETTEIERRSDGQIRVIRRPGGGDTAFEYDALGHLSHRREWVDGDWSTTSFGRDASGRMVSETRANGMRRELALDDLGRTVAIRNLREGLLESEAWLEYQGGRLASLVDSVRGGAELYGYGADGLVARVDFPGGEALHLARDVRGRVAQARFELPAGQPLTTLDFTHDGADRNLSVRKDGMLLIEHGFEAGRLSTISYGNGLQREIVFDPAGDDLRQRSTTFDSAGDLLEDSEVVTSFFHDQSFNWFQESSLEIAGVGPTELLEQFRLERQGVDADYSTATFGPVLSPLTGHGFDGLGNAIIRPYGRLLYNEERNRLLRVEDFETEALVREYEYDEAGFVTAISGVPISWSAHGRVEAIGDEARFVWDARGLPVSQTVAGETTHRLFGGLVSADASWLPRAIDLTEVRIDLSGDEHLYRHLDARSNVKFVSNAQGEIVTGYRYGPFGVEEVVGSDEDGVRFALGAEASGLVLLGERVYDPMARRFLSPDPIHHLLNQFSYPANPVWFWDPDGRELDWIGIAFGVASFVTAGAALAATAGVAVNVAAISLVLGAIGLGVAVVQALIDDGALPNGAQGRERDRHCGCGGGGAAEGISVGSSAPSVAGPENGPLVVIEGHAFRNGRHLGKVGGPDSAFGAPSGGSLASPDCNGQDSNNSSCASVLPLPLLFVFWRSRMMRREV